MGYQLYCFYSVITKIHCIDIPVGNIYIYLPLWCTNCESVNCVIIGLDNGFLFICCKPLSKLMVSYHHSRLTSIRHWSDTFSSDQCLTDVDLRFFVIWATFTSRKILFNALLSQELYRYEQSFIKYRIFMLSFDADFFYRSQCNLLFY